MAGENFIESLNNFDLDQLNDINNVGSWPLAVKTLIWIIAFAALLGLGYALHITNLQDELEVVRKKEVALKKEYEEKALQASLLEDYEAQHREMNEQFDNILRQLPSDTEIPGLIEDINNEGLKNNLKFSSIDLLDEVAHEYYVERPIKIVVSGHYHDIGSFVSDVANLDRIVTLHDFTIKPATKEPGAGEGERLTMQIVAKTYRYNDKQA